MGLKEQDFRLWNTLHHLPVVNLCLFPLNFPLLRMYGEYTIRNTKTGDPYCDKMKSLKKEKSKKVS